MFDRTWKRAALLTVMVLGAVVVGGPDWQLSADVPTQPWSIVSSDPGELPIVQSNSGDFSRLDVLAQLYLWGAHSSPLSQPPTTALAAVIESKAVSLGWSAGDRASLRRALGVVAAAGDGLVPTRVVKTRLRGRAVWAIVCAWGPEAGQFGHLKLFVVEASSGQLLGQRSCED
jgi:hypothetical protein